MPLRLLDANGFSSRPHLVAGTTGEQLADLISFARPGDAVVVVRLDRLGRNIRNTLDVVDQLTRKEVGLISLGEHIDGTTPSGRLAVHMLAALSQYELEQKRLACEAGRKAAVARGRVGGRPRSLDDAKLRIARALLVDQSLSMKEIASQVGCAPSTLSEPFLAVAAPWALPRDLHFLRHGDHRSRHRL
jgi:DNA invertase Pin-like site-specific DNA recombinase